ncbi:MAG: dihydrolipoyl dehydrogenase [Candidatus Omnitrophica bacterium]|nr:dihydrolipoyl dehydrogenase [Candidatus Omnitrophota bacterium]
MQQAQLFIIGAGPAGYTAAFLAADKGLKVTLIDSSGKLGGTCLHHGCIPSKALLHVAKIISTGKEASNLGVTFNAPSLDLEKIASFKNKVITQLNGGLNLLLKKRGITLIEGIASFLNETSLEIKTPDKTITLSFEKCIIATGSLPANPFADAQKDDRVIFSKQALELKTIPKKLLIIGGGYVGLEMATIYSSFGSEVTVCEIAPTLLPGGDQDAIAVLSKKLSKTLSNIHASTAVESYQKTDQGILVVFNGPQENIFEDTFDQVLIAAGRIPNTKNLNLSNANISLNENGFIEIDKKNQTPTKNIYAIGDVSGGLLLAHKASDEAHRIIELISNPSYEQAPRTIPCVIFTDPEIAWCGVTEVEAKEKNMEIKISKIPMLTNGRALGINQRDGFIKLIFDSKLGNIIGAVVVGPEAGELIGSINLAIQNQLTTRQFAETVFPHPSLSETLKECAQSFLGTSAHFVTN